MNLKSIIFDVDGTIADTEDIHRKAFNKAFSEFNLNWRWSRKEYHELLFISGGKERIKKYLNDDKKNRKDKTFIDELHACKSRHYRTMLLNGDTVLRPGIKRLINEAQVKGLKLGIATNSSNANFTTLIKKTLNANPEDIFNTIITSDIVADKKPSSEVYKRALSSLELSADDCIAIEDTANGNISALNANLPTLITTHSYTVDNDFSGASLVVNNLGEPTNAFSIDSNFNCENTFVDIKLLNDIVTNRNCFFIKRKVGTN